MPDETAASSRCPWCSASLPAGAETCPSCGAALVATGEGVPGVTSIDTEAVLRNRSQPKPRGRPPRVPLRRDRRHGRPTHRRPSWPRSAPPDTNVRIEMLRLELEAERQRLESEGAVLASEVAEEDGTPIPAGLFGDASEIPSGSSAAGGSACAGRDRGPARPRSEGTRPASARSRGGARGLTRARRPAVSFRATPPGLSFIREHEVRIHDRAAACRHGPPVRPRRRLVGRPRLGRRRRGRRHVPRPRTASAGRRRSARRARRAEPRWVLLGMITRTTTASSSRSRRRAPPADPARPWDAPAMLIIRDRFEPARVATMSANELADTVARRDRRSVEALGRALTTLAEDAGRPREPGRCPGGASEQRGTRLRAPMRDLLFDDFMDELRRRQEVSFRAHAPAGRRRPRSDDDPSDDDPRASGRSAWPATTTLPTIPRPTAHHGPRPSGKRPSGINRGEAITTNGEREREGESQREREEKKERERGRKQQERERGTQVWWLGSILWTQVQPGQPGLPACASYL